jgi:tetratricopeptide (TPR) repeat protein/predicted Ser/Thr protein kinase
MSDELNDKGLDKTRSFSVITHGMTVSHYRIEKKIGAGGMGEVFLAEDTRLNRKVALKFLPTELTSDPEVKARFTREAQAAAALNHPNIITVYEVAEFQNRLFLAMEYVEGESLRDLLAERELRISEMIDIGMQICQGLAKAHQAGIVHRDIKPQNVLIDRDGRVRIVDFGLAKLKGDAKITHAGSTLGTVSYMSPEQAQGLEVDPRSDIFSLGVMLYEMIAGRLPFEGEHQATILNSILTEEPQLLSRYNNRVSQELERIVSKALSKDREERYQHADDLLADLRREQKISEHLRSSELSRAAVAARPKRNLLKLLVPASVAFLIILFLLILKPFKVEITPERTAVAEERSLAVMYFENLADPGDENRLGEMITSLLITDLSESQYFVRVISRQRLYDILKLLGKEELKKVDRTVASEVARKAQVRWILTGDILQTEPNIVLTSDISDPATGEIVATWRVNGEKGEDIFSVVDKLTTQIKEDLSLPGGSAKGLDKSVADVTTRSPEAYRYYLEGLDNYNRVYFADAERSFRKALEYDSTFAMAYFRLATLRQGQERSELLAKAEEYSDRVSKKERFYIKILQAGASGKNQDYLEGLQEMTKYFPDDKEAFEWLAMYYFEMHQYPEAISYFNKALEIDPLFKLIYNMLAYTYNQTGDFEKSIWAINKYISIAPDEANPYDTRGDLYAWNGKIEQAMNSYRKALETKPDFYASWAKLGHMHLFKREYAQAESCYKELAGSDQKDIRSQGRVLLAYVPAYQGKFKQALKLLDDGLAADRMEQVEGDNVARKHSLKALLYLETSQAEPARQEAEKVVEISRRVYPDNKIWGRQHYAHLLAESGDLKRAEQVASALEKDIGENDEARICFYWYAQGCVDFFEGNVEQSVVNLERAADHLEQFYANYMLARAYLQSGQLDKAVTRLESMLSKYDESRAGTVIWAVKAHYLLGLAYEQSGWNSKAVEQYQEFLKIWKDADPKVPEMGDAKQRLERLTSEA